MLLVPYNSPRAALCGRRGGYVPSPMLKILQYISRLLKTYAKKGIVSGNAPRKFCLEPPLIQPEIWCPAYFVQPCIYKSMTLGYIIPNLILFKKYKKTFHRELHFSVI